MGVIRLSELDDTIDRHGYPINSTDFTQHHDDEIIGLQSGQRAVAQILARLSDGTYTCPQDVRDILSTGVGYGTIGRRYYSDRDLSPLGEDGPEVVLF